MSLTFGLRGSAAPNESLPFATSYTVTGGYQVGGVDLSPGQAVGGFVTGTIPMSNVPANAEILAAFMYWETISSGQPLPVGAVGGKFRGQDLTIEKVAAQSSSLHPEFAPCWSSGGGGNYALNMYRADVLRFLPAQTDTNGNATGKRLVNDTDLIKYGFPLHTVSLPEAGTGNQIPQSAGASLLVVYQDPAATSLTKVVLYDGLFVKTQGVPMVHTIRGFFDASNSNPIVKMTHIVGGGSPNSNDRVYFNGQLVPDGVNAFRRNSGGTSDRSWSNPTFTNLSLAGMDESDPAYGDSVTTSVDYAGQDTPNECLAWSAIVFSTTVDDTDHDGLIDRVENSGGLVEPNGEPLPDIHSMGADKDHKDLFVEVGYMTTAGYTGGQGVVPAHSHRPTPQALKLVGDAYWCAGVEGCDASTLTAPNTNGVRAHFDVGDAFPVYTGADAYAERYIIRGAGRARGGESILELSCLEYSPDAKCRFPSYPGTVGWKIGFQLYRDAPVHANGTELLNGGAPAIPNTSAMDTCEAALSSNPTASEVGDCRRRFDHNRKDIFHYGLFGHAVGVPKSPFPCLTPGTPPTPANAQANGTCATGQTPNPDFAIPRSMSGGGDLDGADFMVTMGFWDNFVGTDFFVASTMMHELGHNMGRWHGGDGPTFTEVGTAPNVRAMVAFEPNCKPNYVSIMSYLFQLYGQRDNNGVPHIGYSNQSGSTFDVNEQTVGDTYSPPGPYRTSWFAPRVPGTLGYTLGVPAATRYCDGAKFPTTLPGGWVDYARIDGATVAAPIDWNGDQDFSDSNYPQNVNFDSDGDADGDAALNTLRASNDWTSLRLDHVGARRNMAGFSSGLTWGGLTWGGTEGGGLTWGGLHGLGLTWGGLTWGGDADDAGGGLTWGGLTWGGLTWGGLSWGGLTWGGLTWGGLTWGGLTWGGLTWGGSETDLETAAASGFSPPNELRVSLVTGDVCNPNTGNPALCHRVRLRFKSPNGGATLTGYHARRVQGTQITPTSVLTPVAGTVTEFAPGQFELIETTELPEGASYTYVVYADYGATATTAATPSGPSNAASITARNDLPIANDDGYRKPYGQPMVPLAGTLASVIGNDRDIDSPTVNASVVTGPLHGALTLNASGTFTYTPVVGFYGTDQFTYAAASPSDPTRTDTAVVTIGIERLVYGFVNSQNLPPSSGKTFKPGTTNPLKWQFTLGGAVVDSSNAAPMVTITGPNGLLATYSQQEPGHSTFKVPTASNGWTWQLNWQTVNEITGAPLPPGTYTVRIYSALSDQTFPLTGTIAIVLR